MVTDDDLSPFIDEDAVLAGEGAIRDQAGLELLVFELGSSRFAVEPGKVVGVVSFTRLTRAPLAHPGVAGLMQDQGRLVTLVVHPTLDAGEPVSPKRVVVCESSHGHVGLPASSTVGVTSLAVEAVPGHREIIEHADGPIAFVSIEAIAAALVAS